jgi:hypothetical protein
MRRRTSKALRAKLVKRRALYFAKLWDVRTRPRVPFGQSVRLGTDASEDEGRFWLYDFAIHLK